MAKTNTDIIEKTKPVTKSVTSVVTSTELDDLKLNSTWLLCTHEIGDPDWSRQSYADIMRFGTIKIFWNLFNNFEKFLDKIYCRDYYLMRENIDPMWEHPKNSKGGICSIQVNREKSFKIFVQLALIMVGESLVANNPLQINGLSINTKMKKRPDKTFVLDDKSYIKVWFDDGTKDITLNWNPKVKELLKGYEMRVKMIVPEN